MQYELLRREWIVPKAPTTMCHASTVLPLADGVVLAAWFGGSHEGEPDTAIWYSRRTNGQWTTPCSLAHMPEAHWNPVLFQHKNGTISLYFKVGQRISDWRTFVCRSTDAGATWTPPQEMVPGDVSGGRGPVRNKIIRLHSGRLLAPGSLEKGVWTAFVDISDDDGVTWNQSPAIAIPNLHWTPGERSVEGSTIAVSEQSFYGRGVIQPSLWEDAAGCHMLLRSTEGAVFRSDSADEGFTWTPAYRTIVPNNNSGLDLVRVHGSLALVCNPVEANWGARSPLSLLLSADNGQSWETLLQLEGGVGEFAYPAVTPDPIHEGILHGSYTWKRTAIAYWSLRLGV